MKVFLTGGSGFIGRHVVAPLLKHGWEVHAAGRRRGVEGTTFHQLDLHDREAVEHAVREVAPTHLLHLAWNATPGQFWTTPENLRWLESSVALLECFVAAGGRRAVFAGTCAEYGRTDVACDEYVTPLEPDTLYGAAKHALESVARTYCAQHRVSFAWGRIFHPYGEGEPSAKLIPAAIRTMLDGRPFESTPGDQVRDFVHVSDVASAFVTLLGSNETGAYNIGSGQPLRVADLLRSIAEEIGAHDLLRLGAIPHREGEAPVVFADVTRLRALGWAPRVPLVRGVQQTIEWWRASSDAS